MKKVLSWILCATPVFYVVLMKATGQPVETAVLLMLLPFIAIPFILGRFLPKDEEEMKATALKVIQTAVMGGHPPRPKQPPARKAEQKKAGQP